MPSTARTRVVVADDSGFIPADEHGKVLDAVWVAGDAMAFPVKQGGLAAQEADAAAEAIAAGAVASTLKVAAATCGLSSLGTGFVVRSDYVLTNAHVIAGAGGAIQVRYNEGSTGSASLVGADTGQDIALIRAERSDLTAAVLGSSDNLRVGDDVVAIVGDRLHASRHFLLQQVRWCPRPRAGLPARSDGGGGASAGRPRRCLAAGCDEVGVLCEPGTDGVVLQRRQHFQRLRGERLVG